MNYQDVNLPKLAEKIGETPIMNEQNVFPDILNKHMTPKGKWAKIIVTEGSLDYVWEDSKDNILTADLNHSIIIEPERFHNVILTGKVNFKIEFYKIKESTATEINNDAKRPGQNFL